MFIEDVSQVVGAVSDCAPLREGKWLDGLGMRLKSGSQATGLLHLAYSIARGVPTLLPSALCTQTVCL